MQLQGSSSAWLEPRACRFQERETCTILPCGRAPTSFHGHICFRLRLYNAHGQVWWGPQILAPRVASGEISSQGGTLFFLFFWSLETPEQSSRFLRVYPPLDIVGKTSFMITGRVRSSILLHSECLAVDSSGKPLWVPGLIQRHFRVELHGRVPTWTFTRAQTWLRKVQSMIVMGAA